MVRGFEKQVTEDEQFLLGAVPALKKICRVSLACIAVFSDATIWSCLSQKFLNPTHRRFFVCLNLVFATDWLVSLVTFHQMYISMLTMVTSTSNILWALILNC